MCLRTFYSSIYNICLGFIKIESKTVKEEARAKPAKKKGSLPLGRASLHLGGADRGQKMVSGSLR